MLSGRGGCLVGRCGQCAYNLHQKRDGDASTYDAMQQVIGKFVDMCCTVSVRPLEILETMVARSVLAAGIKGSHLPRLRAEGVSYRV